MRVDNGGGMFAVFSSLHYVQKQRVMGNHSLIKCTVWDDISIYYIISDVCREFTVSQI